MCILYLFYVDPNEWSVAHVRLWLQWAVRQFNLVGLHLNDWNITGKQLCQLSLSDFHSKVPYDPGDLFWTHLELLRKCKFVGELLLRTVRKVKQGS
jgi:GA-binding protein transcription factor alpha